MVSQKVEAECPSAVSWIGARRRLASGGPQCRIPTDGQKMMSGASAVMRAAATAEARGLEASKFTTRDSLDKLRANGMQILPPSPQLKADMARVGDVLLKEWLEKAGPEGKALVDAYRR